MPYKGSRATISSALLVSTPSPDSLSATSSPPLLLLHGLGSNRRIWDTITPQIDWPAAIHSPDLPGHGQRKQSPMTDSWQQLADQMAAETPAGAIWLSWSMGGLISLGVAARHPGHIHRLLLISSTPCWMPRSDWPTTLAPYKLQAIQRRLQQDAPAAIGQFIALQLADKTLFARLWPLLVEGGMPHQDSLTNGLRLLQKSDLRAALDRLSIPLMLCLGDRDPLLPAALLPYWRSRWPQHAVHLIQGAGHLPFLSAPKAFLRLVDSLR